MRSTQAGFSISKFLIILAVLAGIFIAFFYFKIKGNKIFPISTIKIASDYHRVPKIYFKKVIAEHIEKENFITLNISSLKEQLMQMPWIQDVSIRRVWPGTLLIKIMEQKPTALFNEKGVINQYGEVFYPKPSTIPQNLPRILSNESDLKSVLQYYQQMTVFLAPLSLKIIFLEFSFDGNLKVVLNNKMVLLLGKTDIIRRWKRFTLAYSKLTQEALAKNKHIEQIDLRYPNGFAVKWAPNEAKELPASQ